MEIQQEIWGNIVNGSCTTWSFELEEAIAFQVSEPAYMVILLFTGVESFLKFTAPVITFHVII